MKSSIAFLLAAVVIAVNGSTLQVRAPRRGGNNGGNNNNNANTGNANANTGNANNNSTSANTGAANTGGGDPQTSLTLDPSVICTACTDDGQNPPVAEQSASLTSSNNFINFCEGKTLTDGQQLVGGSCNGVVYGDIIPSATMPGSKIIFPTNGGTFQANADFTFKMNIQNMITGNFVNANTNYYGAPQQLQGGKVVGHSHVTVQLLDAIDTITPADPTVFAFFKGINIPDVNGVLTADVTAGLPPGVYRFCTMNTSANHVPALVAIAQHGSLDDCIYATAVDDGGNNGNSTDTSSTAADASTSANVADASTTAAAVDTTTAVAAATSSAAGGNRGGQGAGRHRNGGGRSRGGRGRHPH